MHQSHFHQVSEHFPLILTFIPDVFSVFSLGKKCVIIRTWFGFKLLLFSRTFYKVLNEVSCSAFLSVLSGFIIYFQALFDPCWSYIVLRIIWTIYLAAAWRYFMSFTRTELMWDIGVHLQLHWVYHKSFTTFRCLYFECNSLLHWCYSGLI